VKTVGLFTAITSRTLVPKHGGSRIPVEAIENERRLKVGDEMNESMEAIILAGGLGTRLASRLDQVPKSMAPIGPRPFLEIFLDQLIVAGCDRVILSVGHLRDVIVQRFGSRYQDVAIDNAMEESPRR